MKRPHILGRRCSFISGQSMQNRTVIMEYPVYAALLTLLPPAFPFTKWRLLVIQRRIFIDIRPGTFCCAWPPLRCGVSMFDSLERSFKIPSMSIFNGSSRSRSTFTFQSYSVNSLTGARYIGVTHTTTTNMRDLDTISEDDWRLQADRVQHLLMSGSRFSLF